MNDQNLDQILSDIRSEDVSPAELAAAQGRVWARLQLPPACREFRGIRPETLTESRRLLLDDHLARCVECRRATNVIQLPAPVTVQKRRFAVPKWAIAAGLAAVGLFLTRDKVDALLAPGGPRATVLAVNGPAYALTGNNLAAGAPLEEAQVIRTARGGRTTLTLADGSTVEVNESTELSVRSAWSGQSIYLERGDIIVHAAKQLRGGLRVITRDSTATVKGTIFTVSTGTAGSLVGVVEGSVAVGGRLLKPGERDTTSASLADVTVKESVAWSANADQYFSLLGELSAIEKKLPAPAVRTQARLLAALPLDPIVYGALPNLGPTVTQAAALIEQRSNESAVLKDWWQSAQAKEIKELIEQVRTLSPLLGDEIVFVLTKTNTPVLLAEVKPGQQAVLTKSIPVPHTFAGNILIASDTDAHLAAIVSQLGKGALSPFAAEIATHYQRGVSMLLGADMQGFPQHQAAENVRFVFFDQRETENEVSLAFSGARTGIASWLASPAAASSAEYVSADAVFAISAATKNPKQILDELKVYTGRFDPGVYTADLAAALGTDFTIAVEAPTLPIPGWLAAVEAYRPELFNSTMERVAAAHSLKVTTDGAWYSLQQPGQMIQLHWTFDRGYLVIGGDRATLQRAIATRNGGFPLVRSAKYRDQLPTSAGLHNSGFVWANVGGAFGNLAGLVSNPALQKLLASREPTLLTFTGETERIRSASRTRLTSLFFDALLAHESSHRN